MKVLSFSHCTTSKVTAIYLKNCWPKKLPTNILQHWPKICCFCATLCDPMDSSPPGFSVHGIFQTRILEWVAISFCRESSWPWEWTCFYCSMGRLMLYHWEAQTKNIFVLKFCRNEPAQFSFSKFIISLPSELFFSTNLETNFLGTQRVLKIHYDPSPASSLTK